METNLVENQYSLSIRIYSDGFSLFVYDDRNKMISSKHMDLVQGEDQIEFLQKTLLSQEESKAEYKMVSFICESIYQTIIPEVFHHAEKEQDFIKLQHPTIPASCDVFHEKIANLQTVLIFAIERQIIEFIRTYFQSASIISHLVHLVNKMIFEETEKLSLWIRAGEIDCIVYKNNKILLLNKYSFHNSEDIVFHILNIYQQFALNPSKFITEIYDDGNTLNEFLLKNYVQTVIIKSKQSIYENYQWKT